MDPIFEHPAFDSARERIKCVKLKKHKKTFENSLYSCFKCESNNVFFCCKTGQVCWWRNICIQQVSWLSQQMEGLVTMLSESCLAYLKKWSPHVQFSTLNPRGFSFRIYKIACVDLLKKSLTMTNSSSVSTLFSSCTILRSALSWDTRLIWPWPAFLDFLAWRNKNVSAAINCGHDVYLKWLILIGTAFFIESFIGNDILDNK